MTPHLDFTWTDAGTVVVIFYIVIKVLQEVRALIAARNGKTIHPILPDHCRACHVMMNEMKAFQTNLMEVGSKYIPSAIAKELTMIESNQKSIMKCQKDMLANQIKIISDLVIMEEHCEGRYKGTQRSIGEIMDEAKKHFGSIAMNTEMLRLIREHNLKSAKVIDSIMREKKL